MKGKYQVMYNVEEELEYLSITGRKFTKIQESIFQFKHDSLNIYSNGYFEDIQSLFLEGYLSWHEKMANLLPLEFQPVYQNKGSIKSSAYGRY